MKTDMKNIVRSLCKEYHVTLPDPVKNFIVSTDIPEEHVQHSVSYDRRLNAPTGPEAVDAIVMKKSLPLNAMKMRELNMPKKWEPELLQ